MPHAARRLERPLPVGSQATPETRREIVLVGLVRAARHALVARIDEAERRLREARRLLAGTERVQRIVRVDERHATLRSARRGSASRSTGAGTRPARSRRRSSRARPAACCGRAAELRRQTEQEVGGGVAGACVAPVKVKSPFGRFTNAMNMCWRCTSPPNLNECWPRIQVKSSVKWNTSFSRSTNGCCASPRLKNPVIPMLASPRADRRSAAR